MGLVKGDTRSLDYGSCVGARRNLPLPAVPQGLPVTPITFVWKFLLLVLGI